MEISEDELAKRIDEKVAERLATAQRRQSLYELGRAWFTEALAHTGNLAQRGEFLQEAHQVGLQIQQQFIADMTGQRAAAPEKKSADDEAQQD